MRLQVSARADYAMRATAELAVAGERVTAEQLAERQGIPVRFLLNILGSLVHAGIVTSHRGSVGGYELARAAEDITLAEIIAAVEEPRLSHWPARVAPHAEIAEAVRRFRSSTVATLDALLRDTTVADLVRPAGETVVPTTSS
jgi:Rrf2 family protein